MRTFCRRVKNSVPVYIYVLIHFLGGIGGIDLWSERENGRLIVEGRSFFFELNQTRHVWTDAYTVLAYGFNAYFSMGHTEFSWLRGPHHPSKEELASLPVGEAITTKWDNHPNTAMLSLVDHAPLVKEDIMVFDGLINVGLVYRYLHNDWIVATRYKIARLPGDNTTAFAGPNMTSVAQWLGNAERNTALNSPSILWHKTVDARLIVLNGGARSVLVNNVHNHALDYTETLISDVVVNLTHPLTPTTGITNTVLVISSRPEKNWTPFSHRDNLYFLASVWPFHVVRVSTVNTSHPQFPKNRADVHPDQLVGIMKTVNLIHLDPKTCMQWPWSSHRHLAFRGGTQSIDIGNGTFFGVFHAQSNLTTDDYGTLRTYTMGAFTFEAVASTKLEREKTPVSFQLTAVSKTPIVDRSWYTGKWFYDKNAFGKVDYIVYPMSLFVEGDELVILYGRMDVQTRAARFSLSEVLESLTPVSAAGFCG